MLCVYLCCLQVFVYGSDPKLGSILMYLYPWVLTTPFFSLCVHQLHSHWCQKSNFTCAKIDVTYKACSHVTFAFESNDETGVCSNKWWCSFALDVCFFKNCKGKVQRKTQTQTLCMNVPFVYVKRKHQILNKHFAIEQLKKLCSIGYRVPCLPRTSAELTHTCNLSAGWASG